MNEIRRMMIPPVGAYCTHEAMTECCPGCGHWSCPCGVSFDDWGEGGEFGIGPVREVGERRPRRRRRGRGRRAQEERPQGERGS